MDSNILAAARPIASPLEVFVRRPLSPRRPQSQGRHPKTFTEADHHSKPQPFGFVPISGLIQRSKKDLIDHLVSAGEQR
jgi:hypothetical protein